MFTDREIFIIKMALIYMQANLDDVNDVFVDCRGLVMDMGPRFSALQTTDDITDRVNVDGEVGDLVDSKEIEKLLVYDLV